MRLVKGMRKIKEIGAKVLQNVVPVFPALDPLKPGIDYVANNGGRTLLSPLDPLFDKYLLNERTPPKPNLLLSTPKQITELTRPKTGVQRGLDSMQPIIGRLTG